jgi:hypothetical protein
MRASIRWLGPPLLASGVALMGCGDAPSDAADPNSVQSYAASASSASECQDDNGGGRFHRRCHHYKHSDRAHWSQNGQAKMTTRALMDVNHVTQVELTTGTFDDGSVPPGWFDRVTIRSAKLRKHFSLDQDGDDNDFNDIKTKSGYFAVGFPTPAPGGKNKPLPTLMHGQKLRITGVVKGMGGGNANLRVDDQVKYRPDLSVVRIDAPTATVGMPASITATIQERMGDTGALADCLLSVDGAPADSAKNIWVDESGTVTCQFAHTFTTGGTHALHVDAANVRPADYDTRNNGADATIAIAADFSFTGSAMDSVYSSSYREQVLDANAEVLFEQNSTSTGSNGAITISGLWHQAVAFPVAASIDASSAGATWSLFASNAFAGTAQDDGSTCASGPDDSGANWVTLCASTAGGPMTQVTVSSFSGDVTYHSDMTCRQTSSFYACAGGYTFNSDGTSVSGVRHLLDGALTSQLKITDAAGASLAATAVIPVQPYTVAQDQAMTCTAGPDGASDCIEQHYSETGTKGSVGQ